MAEFSVVMKHAKRMCEAQEDCEECPIGANIDCVCVIADLIEMMDAKKMERIVMDWAAKNPEPKYPTWSEVWKQLFPNANYHPCPQIFDSTLCIPGMTCGDCRNRPIPEEMAAILHIDPIGG